LIRKLKYCMLIGAIAWLPACSGGSGGASGPSDGGNAEKPSDEPVELVFYSIARDSEESFNERMGNDIRQKFPNVTIKYIQRTAGETDLEQILLTDQKIDMIWGSQATWGSVLKYGLEYDMTELIKKHDVDLSRIEPGLVEAIKQRSDGGMYGIPYENSTMAIYYNKDIFDKFGVEYPKDGMTWDEFYELARKVTGSIDGQDYIGFSPSQNHMVLMNPFSLPLIDPATGRSTYGDAKWKTILETELLRFAKDPVYKSAMEKYRKGKLPDTNTFLKDRVVAMYPGGPLTPIVLASEMAAFNWDLVAAPTYEDRQGTGFQSYPNYISITNMSEHKDEAMEVIKFLISDEYQTKLSRSGNMTVLRNEQIQKQMGEDGAFKGKNYSAYFYNKLAPIAQGANVQTDKDPLYSITNRLVPIINGEIDINTALRQAEEEVNMGIKAVSSR